MVELLTWCLPSAGEGSLGDGIQCGVVGAGLTGHRQPDVPAAVLPAAPLPGCQRHSNSHWNSSRIYLSIVPASVYAAISECG